MTESGQLNHNFRHRLYKILAKISVLQDEDTRNLLLDGLPSKPVSTIRRNPAWQIDLRNILNIAEGWGQLASGEFALVVIAQNALSLVEETQPGHELEVLLAEFDSPSATTSNRIYGERPNTKVIGPDLKAIRRQLTKMDDTELDFFCEENFPDVVEKKFTDNMAKDRKILWLIKHCKGDNYQALQTALQTIEPDPLQVERITSSIDNPTWPLPDRLTSDTPRLPYEPETVFVPAGIFWMGSDEGKANRTLQHQVTLPPYWIGKYPVLNKEYARFIKEVKNQDEPEDWFLRRPPHGKDDHPVVGISWYDARAYCRWLSEKTNRTYRLPSEAEWEKAARGTTGQRYPWGEDWANDCCNAESTGATPVTDPADQVSPYHSRGGSPYGCYDMVGNVEEWTTTLWGSNSRQSDFEYPYDFNDGREDLEAAPHIFRIHRGGSFQDHQDDLSCHTRSYDNPENRLDWRGFRVVREP